MKKDTQEQLNYNYEEIFSSLSTMEGEEFSELHTWFLGVQKRNIDKLGRFHCDQLSKEEIFRYYRLSELVIRGHNNP